MGTFTVRRIKPRYNLAGDHIIYALALEVTSFDTSALARSLFVPRDWYQYARVSEMIKYIFFSHTHTNILKLNMPRLF